MKTVAAKFILFASIWTLFASSVSYADKSFTGTWCVGEEGLIINFLGKDSVAVRSKNDETMQGRGTYTVKDSLLTTSIANGDIIIAMGYRYSWKNDSSVTARVVFFTVNGDSADFAPRPLTINRCAAPAKTTTPGQKKKSSK
jgi:hypothetical protein